MLIIMPCDSSSAHSRFKTLLPVRATARHQLGKLTYQRVGFVGFGDESSASRQRAGIGLNPSGGYENGDLRPTLGDHAASARPVIPDISISVNTVPMSSRPSRMVSASAASHASNPR